MKMSEWRKKQMKMSEWAKNEVKLACKRENPDWKEGEFDYGCSCYGSALKAYESLCGDGHSITSFGFTAGILKRLLNHRPLTPIEDTYDEWAQDNWFESEFDYTLYRAMRLSSLSKRVYSDGKVTYSDVDRFYCVDINDGSTYYSGRVAKIIDELFPITMPYYPDTEHIRVYCEKFLVDEKNGDFDVFGVLYAIFPDGSRKEINKFFTEVNDKWNEIILEEYNKLKEGKIR